jgi:hypothetical protein
MYSHQYTIRHVNKIACFVFISLGIISCGSSGSGGDVSPCCDPLPPLPAENKSIVLTVPDYLSSSTPNGINGDITYSFDNWLARTNGVSVYDYSTGSKGAKLGEFAVVSNLFQAIMDIPLATSALLLEAHAPCNWEGGHKINRNLFNRIESYLDADYVCHANVASMKSVITADSQTVSFTPFTHAAVALAEYQILQGDNVSTAITAANAAISAMVGVDVLTSDTAVNLNSIEYIDTPKLFYTMILSGMPSVIYNECLQVGFAPSVGQIGYTVYDLAELMRRDLVGDGVLDGVETDSMGMTTPILLGGSGLIQLSTHIYRHEIAAHAAIIGRAYSTSAPLYPNLDRIVAFNDSTSSIYDNSLITPLDESGPLLGMLDTDVTFYSTHPNVNGDEGFRVFFGDVVGNYDYTYRYVYVDNVFYANGCDGDTRYSDYTCHVNTTLYPNGWHTIRMVFTNIMGHSVSLSITVNFQN